MSAPRVAGIDLSLTSTGLADSQGRVDTVTPKRRGDTLTDEVKRIRTIAEEVVHWASGNGDDIDEADLVVVEGPAFSRTSGHAHTRGGLWWVTVCDLVALGFPILVVGPTQRAMYATGVGSASKDTVLAAAIRRYPSHDITGNDVGDAVVLAAIGARMLGHPIDGDMPKTHLRALAKLALPTT